MTRSRITLSQLRAFEALLRTKSFSKAAEDLSISQPSVSNQIRALERLCGAPLIHRIGHVIEPAPLAQALTSKIRTAVSLINDIERIILDGRDMVSGELRVGYSTYQYAIPIIARFVEHFPGVQIDAISMASLDLLEGLNSASIDVALITAQDPPEDLFARKILDTRIVLMAPKSHALARQRSVTWDEIRDVPILRRESASMTRVIFDAAAQRAGVSPRRFLSLGSWGSMRAAVESGMGTCIALREEIEHRDNVAVLEIDDPQLWASHYVVCRPELAPAASIQEFFKLALAQPRPGSV